MKASRTLAVAVSLAVASALQPAAIAGSVTGSMPVSLTVTGTCSSVNASALNFGSASNDSTGNVNGQAQITVNCSTGTTYTIDLDNGTNPYPSGMRALSGAGGYFAYRLFTDATMTREWGSGQQQGALVGGVMGATGSADHTVYGNAFFGIGTTPGTYTDTVTVTVNY